MGKGMNATLNAPPTKPRVNYNYEPYVQVLNIIIIVRFRNFALFIVS